MKKFSDILSAIFHPLLIPLFAFGLLFVFTYLNIMPIQYIAFVLSIVATFTLLAPLLFISLYKRMNHLSMEDLSERKKRFIPYILTMMSYATCLLTMYKMHFPYYFSSIIVAALMSLIICTLLNFRWKISIHLAGCGLLISGLIAYSFLFYFKDRKSVV